MSKKLVTCENLADALARLPAGGTDVSLTQVYGEYEPSGEFYDLTVEDTTITLEAYVPPTPLENWVIVILGEGASASHDESNERYDLYNEETGEWVYLSEENSLLPAGMPIMMRMHYNPENMDYQQQLNWSGGWHLSQFVIEYVAWGDGLQGLHNLGRELLVRVPETLPLAINDLQDVFKEAYIFNQPLPLWNTESVRSFRGAFRSAESYNQSINTWSTDSVDAEVLDYAFESMFEDAVSFNQDMSIAWCFPNGGLEPSRFSYNATAWEENNKPNWICLP